MAKHTLEDLKNIYIRAEVDGKWQSVSLQELYDMGGAGQVFEWAFEKLNRMEGVQLTRENLLEFVNLLESFGQPIVKVKEEYGN